MFKKSTQMILAPGMALAILAASSNVIADAQDVTEARQESQIWTTYALSPYLRANDLKVSVQNGKATLSGKVDEDVNKDLAKQIALGVSGIKEVDNRIEVLPDFTPAKAATVRNYGEIVDDASITAAVRSRLGWNKQTSNLDTDITTTSGKVVLRGHADSAAAKQAAGRLAMDTRGVVAVDNQILVNDRKPTAGDKAKVQVDKAEKNFSDSWITTKVKSTLLYSSNVVGSNIEVSTENGVVKLKGNVGSGAERALAIELAQNVHGVKQVNAKGLGF